MGIDTRALIGIGERFGRLVVLADIPFADRLDRARWQCLCDCGTTTRAETGHLRGGNRISCGCAKVGNVKHGHTGSMTYARWRSIIQRCHLRFGDEYTQYGSKGIAVCVRWRRSFEAFLADMGECPSPAHTVDRIKNALGYTPSNCRWATRAEQMRNRTDNRWLNFGGERMVMKDWASRLAMNESTLRRRLKLGWSIERALTTPVKRSKD